MPIDQRIGWKLQREIVLLLAWGPAILLQLAHPLVAQGIADHSSFRTQRRGRTRRLYHTIDAMLQLCFGTEDQAQATLARINAIHDRVNGHLAGPHARSRTISRWSFQPMRWSMGTSTQPALGLMSPTMVRAYRASRDSRSTSAVGTMR